MTDIYLTRLHLKQFRSFADLTIETDDGPGVVIVHGSNGLGKSSLFHGLEWVLTDQIDQFREPAGKKPAGAYLCRWRKPTAQRASVALTFSDGQVLKRSLVNSKSRTSTFEGPPDVGAYLKAPTWEPDIQELRHYLLLTHFLSQSNMSRLAYREPGERFDILREAAHSRPVQRIAAALHGLGTSRAARAYRTLRTQAEADLGALEDWLGQEARSWAEAQTAGALDDDATAALAGEIETLARSAAAAGAVLDQSPDRSPNRLAAALAAGETDVRRQQAEATRARRGLEAWRKMAAERAAVDEVVTAGEARIAALADELTAAAEARRAASDSLDRAVAALADGRARAARLNELAAARTELTVLEGEASPPDTTPWLRQRDVADQRIAQIQKGRQLGARLAAEVADLVTAQADALQKLDAADAVTAAQSRLDESETRLAALTAASPFLALQLQTAADDLARAEASVVDLEAATTAMAESMGLISAAVSTIAAHLPPTLCECPVCGTHFAAPDALRQQAIESTVRLGPQLGALQARLALAQTDVTLKADAHSALVAAEADLTLAQAAVDTDRLAHLAASATAAALGLSQADGSITSRERIEADLETVARKLGRRLRWQVYPDLSPMGRESDLQDALRSRDEAVRALAIAARGQADREARRQQLAAEIEQLNRDLFGGALEGPEDMDVERRALAEAQASLQQMEADAQIALAAAEAVYRRLDLDLAEQHARRQTQEADRQRLERERSDEEASWVGLEAFGPLSEDAGVRIDTVVAELERQSGQLAEAEAKIAALRAGRAAWQGRQAQGMVLAQLRARVGAAANAPRAPVRAAAETECDRLRRHIQAIDDTKALADAASVEIEARLKTFDEKNIRPLTDLLGRVNLSILCDPRIGINFKVGKSKIEQAAIKQGEVPDDLGDLDPRLVHSEGQMSALTVSLLCAASLTFPWSRWKALVLDDPLQNNDAIHASAFADFVSNLVDARRYQVFLSTHDQAQAEFLQRKFRARRLACTLVSLVGLGAHGVAEVIERQQPLRAAVGGGEA